MLIEAVWRNPVTCCTSDTEKVGKTQQHRYMLQVDNPPALDVVRLPMQNKYVMSAVFSVLSDNIIRTAGLKQ